MLDYLNFAKKYAKKLLRLSKNSIDLFIDNEMISFLINQLCSNCYEYNNPQIIWKGKNKLFLILIEEQPKDKVLEIIQMSQKFIGECLQIFYKESNDWQLVINEKFLKKTHKKCYRFN